MADRAQKRRDEFLAREVEAAAEGGRSAHFGGDGLPGSSQDVPAGESTEYMHATAAEAAAAAVPPVPDSDLEDEPQLKRTTIESDGESVVNEDAEGEQLKETQRRKAGPKKTMEM